MILLKPPTEGELLIGSTELLLINYCRSNSRNTAQPAHVGITGEHRGCSFKVHCHGHFIFEKYVAGIVGHVQYTAWVR